VNTDLKRRRWEAVIRWVDIIVALLVFASGWFAVLATPDSILRQVYFDWLIWVWGSLLLLGGVLAVAGRFIRIWAIELPGLVAAMFGVAIYGVVLGSIAVGGKPTVWVATCIAVIALITMFRRYVEIQLFILEPRETPARTYRDLVREAIKRRTPDFQPRQNH